MLTGIVMLVLGLGLMFGSAGRAVTRYPDRLDPERNAARYVGPAFIGLLLAGTGLTMMISNLLLSVVT